MKKLQMDVSWQCEDYKKKQKVIGPGNNVYQMSTEFIKCLL